MRLSDHIRRCVVFIGVGESDDFRPLGTGFLFAYERSRYLVTAAHIADQLGDEPFIIRLNRVTDDALFVSIDPTEHHTFAWQRHPRDRSIDLAVMPFNFSFQKLNLDHGFLTEDWLISDDPAEQPEPGDLCYTVGLFRLFAGSKRNLPTVHSGNLALVAGQEKVAVAPWWRSPDAPTVIGMDAHLVEAVNLDGLSGAPVFFRYAVDLDLNPIVTSVLRGSSADVKLLGIWHGSWEGDSKIRPGTRVPVGMGIVTPSSKLKELLDCPELAQPRAAWLAKLEAEGDVPT